MKIKEKGSILIIAVVTVSILMILSGYLLSSILMEMRISKSIESAEKAYYFAESGINEAIWKLENDIDWKEGFISQHLNTGESYWSDSFSRDLDGGSYTVTIENTAQGKGEIIAIAEVPFMGKTAKRKVKVTVFRSTESPTNDAGIFTGGSGENISISHSQITINDGNLFSNHHLQISGISTLAIYDNPETDKLEGKALAVQSIDGDEMIISYTALCSANFCSEECEECPPEDASVPMVDFDSDDANSFLSRAKQKELDGECAVYCNDGAGSYLCSDKCVFSEKDFEDLLWEAKSALVLENEVTYITGGLELRGGRRLELNGAMVVNGNVSIGERYAWVRGGQREEGFSHIEATSYGVLSKRKIDFGNYSLAEESTINGVIYAGDQINMVGIPEKMNVIGGIIGRKMSFTSLWSGLEVTLDNDEIMRGLGYMIDGYVNEPHFSPVIQIDHWEEVY